MNFRLEIRTMRATLLALPLALLGSPVIAEAPAQPNAIQLPPELTDPRWADRLTDAVAALSKAFLDMPVGEVEAAIEGRQPTLADKSRTVRSETKMSERELRQEIEAARPAMQAGIKAMAAALPAMMEGLSKAQDELDRAAANMPQPGYPKR
jgi:hypothetical protein